MSRFELPISFQSVIISCCWIALLRKANGRRVILDWKELLGFIGGALITIGFIPQVWRLFKLKSAHEISLTFTILFILGAAFWLSYGISMRLASVILWNVISLVIMCAILYAKLRYGR